MSAERQALIDELVRDEGLRLKPYLDTVGKWTLGVGRNISDKGISSREAFDLLDHDVDECVADLAGEFPWFVRLDAVRQRVVVNMRFQLGAAGFRKFTATIAAIAAGDYVKAGDHMQASLWARQVPARASRLIRRMKIGSVDA